MTLIGILKHMNIKTDPAVDILKPFMTSLYTLLRTTPSKRFTVYSGLGLSFQIIVLQGILARFGNLFIIKEMMLDKL